MMATHSLQMAVAVLAGIVLGLVGYRAWSTRMTKNKRRIPEQWQLRVKPVFTGVERTVWHWLERVFFDHHVLVKTPVLRFLSPRSATQGQQSYELLKGVYCSFTVCTSDGDVVGCVDVPASMGLNASHREVKKKLFEQCGVAYAVLNPNQLPTLEALRTAFLGSTASARQPSREFETSSLLPSSQSADMPDVPDVPDLAPASAPSKAVPTVSGTAQPGHKVSGPASPPGIDMTVVAAARSSLQSRLDQNRKVRVTKADEVGASLGFADDKADQKFAAPWDDSFIMGEEVRKSSSHKH
ncbi:MAG: DUF2726 domain-containing protein [Polaromonas sp.]|nr:MAG: DUF2726 domain-containing protein [Polaromonas sp.]